MIHHHAARGVRGRHITVNVTLTNNNQDLLLLVQQSFEGSMSAYKNKHRLIHRLSWTNKDSIRCLLGKILPYLILKRQHALLMLEYIKQRPPQKRATLSMQDIDFANRMVELNSKLRFRLPKPKGTGFQPRLLDDFQQFERAYRQSVGLTREFFTEFAVPAFYLTVGAFVNLGGLP